ncbi:MAG: DUF423 domain-containing protein [Bacillaceae bacterium]|nr:DUF423 domain-containing protein [Bacillaceae bacterium]
MKIFVFLGSINAFLAVALGAFGAHALESVLSPDMMEVYHTGTYYHMVHALALVLIGILSDRLQGSRLVARSGWLIFLGIILFSGSLYALSMTGVRGLGMITPFGGVSFLIGWILLAVSVFKTSK